MIQPGPGGRRLSSAIEIVFWPGAMRTGPQRNFRWRTPFASCVVVIVPCEVRTVVERGVAPRAASAQAGERQEREDAARAAPRRAY